MKTIEINLYKFEELNKEAKEAAIENYRSENSDFEHIYYDAEKTVKAFCDAFNVETGRNSWLDVSLNHLEEYVLNLSGLRLRKYLINNFSDVLYRRKYLKSGEILDGLKPWHPMRKQKTLKAGPDKGKIYVSYYSNLFKVEDDCNLTGIFYDHSIMKPLYKFINSGFLTSLNFEDVLKECFDSLKKCLDKEEEYMDSDEYIIEMLTSNDYDFTENGEIY
jgi:hypothetical protein